MKTKHIEEMTKCILCQSKMPEELFVSAFINGGYIKDLCPICTMVKINLLHGLPFGILPQGEIARELVEDAWQYYKPVGENIYGLL